VEEEEERKNVLKSIFAEKDRDGERKTERDRETDRETERERQRDRRVCVRSTEPASFLIIVFILQTRSWSVQLVPWSM
jgi:hypothetical protein